MKAFITGLPLGYFTLVFSKLKTLSKFEWTGQQNHKRNRLPFIFVFFFLGARHSQCKQGRGHSSLPLKYVAVFKEYEKHFTCF